MAVELGDYGVEIANESCIVANVDSDGTGSAGDAVTMNASQQVSQYTADGADFFGVLVEDSPSSGEKVAVLIHGDVIANAGGSITAGDLVELPGSTNGRVEQNTQGTEIDVDEGGTATYTIPTQTAKALTDSGGTTTAGESLGANEAVIYVY